MDGPAAPGAPGLGPLRIWPGGLCVSRGIGDIDVGEPVIASPHVRQVVVPTWGCRIILASDGVWDCISTRNVISSVRGRTCASACNAVVHKCLRVKQGSLVDDTTCCVVDCRPHNVASFKGYSPEKNTMHSGRAMVRLDSSTACLCLFLPPVCPLLCPCCRTPLCELFRKLASLADLVGAASACAASAPWLALWGEVPYCSIYFAESAMLRGARRRRRSPSCHKRRRAPRR